jgi:5-methyltetrahydrofolate--homocysteine methyltransferase
MMRLDDIADSLIRGDANEAARLTREALDAGFAPDAVLERGLMAGMSVIGVKFKNNEIFVPEVLVAARAMKAGMQHLEPILAACGIQPAGKYLIGTVKGDIHDIGKNLVVMMLTGAGFEVIDLGVNVPASKFMEAIEAHQPDIIGLSALLTTTMIQMKHNLQAFRDAGVLDRVKVMVGGAPVTAAFAKEIGADEYGKDAAEATEKALKLIREMRQKTDDIHDSILA